MSAEPSVSMRDVWLDATVEAVKNLHANGGNIIELMPLLVELHGGDVTIPSLDELRIVVADITGVPIPLPWIERLMNWLRGRG